MNPTNPSVEEIKAVAGAAISTRHAADAAKAAHEAKPDDASLKTAYDQAETAAGAAKAKADALSQKPPLTPEQIAKKKRKIAIIQKELEHAGASEDTDEDDDEDDDDKPLTRGDLKRMDAQKASDSAKEMAEAIPDPAAKQAVKDALASVVPSGDAAADFKKAVAIANIDKNNKVLEEIQRSPAPVVHRSGAGAPPKKQDGEFTPTAEEQRFMRPPFNLTKEDVIKSRG